VVETLTARLSSVRPEGLSGPRVCLWRFRRAEATGRTPAGRPARRTHGSPTASQSRTRYRDRSAKVRATDRKSADQQRRGSTSDAREVRADSPPRPERQASGAFAAGPRQQRLAVIEVGAFEPVACGGHAAAMFAQLPRWPRPPSSLRAVGPRSGASARSAAEAIGRRGV